MGKRFISFILIAAMWVTMAAGNLKTSVMAQDARDGFVEVAVPNGDFESGEAMPKTVERIPDTMVKIQPGKKFMAPDEVEALYTDGSKGLLPVVWSEIGRASCRERV